MSSTTRGKVLSLVENIKSYAIVSDFAGKIRITLSLLIINNSLP